MLLKAVTWLRFRGWDLLDAARWLRSVVESIDRPDACVDAFLDFTEPLVAWSKKKKKKKTAKC